MAPPPCYSSRLDQALALAADAFRGHRRKGTAVPYLTHLMQVMVWVGEHGGTEDQMIAALLHDYIEDIRGASPQTLEDLFGPHVRRLVEALSDSHTHPKPPWRARKEAFLAHLRQQPAEVKLICACDKLHNARSILRDRTVVGEAIWERFTGKREGTLWYYREVVAALAQGWEHTLLDALRATVDALHR